jgi:purine-cytosine permease-like protein
MTNPELRSDVHSIEPIPDADRDSTGPQQMWIWAGANIAPVNWALGALGIILKLGLWETIAVIVIGNLFGCCHLRRVHGDGPQDRGQPDGT